MWNPAKAILLPTNQEARLGSIFKHIKKFPLHDDSVDSELGSIGLNKNHNVLGTNEYVEHQHLYIYSEKLPIRNGDWYLNDNKLYKADQFYEMSLNDKKVIASTNKLKPGTDAGNHIIQTISSEFLIQFCYHYNKIIKQPRLIQEVNVLYNHDSSKTSYKTSDLNLKINHLAPRTVNEWLKLIPYDNLKTAALKNSELYNFEDGRNNKKIALSLSEALDIAFDWGKSPEGSTFWIRIVDLFEKMEKKCN